MGIIDKRASRHVNDIGFSDIGHGRHRLRYSKAMRKRGMVAGKDGKRNALGSRLAALRRAAGLSQSALVERLQLKTDWDCDKAVLASIENGRRSLTDLELLAILKVLKLRWADL